MKVQKHVAANLQKLLDETEKENMNLLNKLDQQLLVQQQKDVQYQKMQEDYYRVKKDNHQYKKQQTSLLWQLDSIKSQSKDKEQRIMEVFQTLEEMVKKKTTIQTNTLFQLYHKLGYYLNNTDQDNDNKNAFQIAQDLMNE